MHIYQAQASDIAKIKSIADQVWVNHYATIISQEQIDYMYPLMYSEASLAKQMQDGHQFFIANLENQEVGFISIKREKDCIKIPKIYVSKAAHGKGIGRMLIEHIAKLASQEGFNALELNVNRYNTNAIAFYKKVGFIIKEEVDIPLDKFVLEDYVMIYQLAVQQLREANIN